MKEGIKLDPVIKYMVPGRKEYGVAGSPIKTIIENLQKRSIREDNFKGRSIKDMVKVLQDTIVHLIEQTNSASKALCSAGDHIVTKQLEAFYIDALKSQEPEEIVRECFVLLGSVLGDYNEDKAARKLVFSSYDRLKSSIIEYANDLDRPEVKACAKPSFRMKRFKFELERLNRRNDVILKDIRRQVIDIEDPAPANERRKNAVLFALFSASSLPIFTICISKAPLFKPSKIFSFLLFAPAVYSGYRFNQSVRHYKAFTKEKSESYDIIIMQEYHNRTSLEL